MQKCSPSQKKSISALGGQRRNPLGYGSSPPQRRLFRDKNEGGRRDLAASIPTRSGGIRRAQSPGRFGDTVTLVSSRERQLYVYGVHCGSEAKRHRQTGLC